MKKYRTLIAIALWVIALSFLGWLLVRDSHFPVLSPAGVVGESQKDLMLFTVYLSLIVVVPVFTMLGLFAWKYREGANARYTPDVAGNNKVEALWWGIPILIIGLLSVVTWQTSHSLDPYRPLASENKAIEVQVVALQWKWLFIYPELGVASVNHLPVPVDVPVHFSLTANAPMSAFWVPALGSQIYAMNGMSSQLNLIANQTGKFDGYTTNINGAGYADMKFVVTATDARQFDAWVNEARGSKYMMDGTAYKQLAEPGSADPKSYMLMDKTLYQSIVGSHMSENDDHEMQKMEAM